jgi:hypothetical protein
MVAKFLLKLPLAMTYIKIIAIIYLVTYIISGITLSDGFMAYFNLHLKAETLSFTEGWASGCWFVPFISLYRPKQIMNELYVETQNLLTTKQENSMVNLNTQFIGWWWALWLIASFLGQFVFRYSQKAETLEELTTVTIVSIIASIMVFLSPYHCQNHKDYAEIEPLFCNLDVEIEQEQILLDTDFSQ